MRTAQFTFLWVLATFCIPNPALGADPTAEEKWAKGIAEDYWRALRAGQGEQAAALLSPELAQSLLNREPLFANGPLPKWPTFNTLPGVSGPEVTASNSAQELAPDRSEVVLRGKLSGKNARGERVAAEFTMRVAREKDGGKWSIRYLLVTDRDKKP
ncbi:unnamed protein product [Gemmata massiliana]|uniref:DUF4440 domain-containing protein n=1 Tax=Gemmata massiliana TaxID=1210884 RepID=A0A6P2CR75_9BACT|nr:hypothetical protein [Gemmata massiliana]VTR91568.1 unnamed protein product [Gemmata massiliana]